MMRQAYPPEVVCPLIGWGFYANQSWIVLYELPQMNLVRTPFTIKSTLLMPYSTCGFQPPNVAKHILSSDKLSSTVESYRCSITNPRISLFCRNSLSSTSDNCLFPWRRTCSTINGSNSWRNAPGSSGPVSKRGLRTRPVYTIRLARYLFCQVWSSGEETGLSHRGVGVGASRACVNFESQRWRTFHNPDMGIEWQLELRHNRRARMR